MQTVFVLCVEVLREFIWYDSNKPKVNFILFSSNQQQYPGFGHEMIKWLEIKEEQKYFCQNMFSSSDFLVIFL